MRSIFIFAALALAACSSSDKVPPPSPDSPFDTGDTATPSDPPNDPPPEEDPDFIRILQMSTVYFVDENDKRHAFPNDATFYTWEESIDIVETVTVDEMADIELGFNMTVKPGVIMVKIMSDTKVYWVEGTTDPLNPQLRWVINESVAEAMIGWDWNTYILDVPDVFFVDYDFGPNIEDASDVVVDPDILKRRDELVEP